MAEAQTGTKPISGAHPFDVAALRAYLESRVDGFQGPVTVEQFKGGQSNPTYKLSTPERSYVMRCKPARQRSCWPRRMRSIVNSP